jgi:hypothetical protein
MTVQVDANEFLTGAYDPEARSNSVFDLVASSKWECLRFRLDLFCNRWLYFAFLPLAGTP